MIKIKWLGQAGYMLTDGVTSVCIDPYLSDSVNRIASRPRVRAVPIEPEKLKCDAVICTHNHLDHLDIDSIPLMDRKIRFYAPEDCKDVLFNLGVRDYTAFNEGEKIKIGSFEISAVFAEHSVPAIGVVVKHGDDKLYFTGDTLYNERLANVKCDILFICINGKLGNMNADEAVRIAEMIAPATAVPNHYDMFESNSENPEKFKYKNSFIMEFNKEYEVKNGCLI